MGTAEAAIRVTVLGTQLAALLWMEQDYSWFAEEDRTGWCWSPIPPASPSYIYFSPPPGSSGRALRVSILHSRTVGWGSDSLVLNGVTVFDSTFINNRYVRLWTVREPPLNPGVNTLKIWSRKRSGTSFSTIWSWRSSRPRDRQAALLPGRPPAFTPLRSPGSNREPGPSSQTRPSSPWNSGMELQGHCAHHRGDHADRFKWVVNPGEWKSPEAIQYAQPGRIVGTGLAGDVVVLAPEAFMDVAAALEAVYAARGLTVALASYRRFTMSSIRGSSHQGQSAPL
jgi:hypothetical protein